MSGPLRTAEAAAVLGRSCYWVRERAKAGTIPHTFDAQGHLRFDAAVIEKLKGQNVATAGPKPLSKLDALVIELAGRPTGVRSHEVPAATPRKARGVIAKLVKLKHLIGVRLSAKSAVYFRTHEQITKFKLAQYKSTGGALPVEAKAPDGPVTVPTHIKVQYGASPPIRNQAIPLLTDRPPAGRRGSEDFKQWQRPGRY